MAVIPTFSSYAQTPNLAQAYLGGQEIQVARERIAQQAAEAAGRIALGRQQLQAEQVANEMEWSAKKDIAARQALQQAQEFEIEKAYRQTQLGMAQRNLAMEESLTRAKLQEAAQEFEAQQEWNRKFPIYTDEGIKAGLLPQDARSAAARRLIYERGGTGIATALNPPNPPRERMFDVVTGVEPLGGTTRTRMTGPEFQRWRTNAPEEVATNATNVAIGQLLTPPASITGTNAPTQGKRLRYNPATGEFE